MTEESSIVRELLHECLHTPRARVLVTALLAWCFCAAADALFGELSPKATVAVVFFPFLAICRSLIIGFKEEWALRISEPRAAAPQCFWCGI